MTDLREDLGRVVRDTWVEWARQQPDPKPSWLTPWHELDPGQREVDMRIGMAVAAHVLARIEGNTDTVPREAVDLAVEAVEGIIAWRTALRDAFARRVIVSTAVRAATPTIVAAVRAKAAG